MTIKTYEHFIHRRRLFSVASSEGLHPGNRANFNRVLKSYSPFRLRKPGPCEQVRGGFRREFWSKEQQNCAPKTTALYTPFLTYKKDYATVSGFDSAETLDAAVFCLVLLRVLRR